MVNNRQQCCFLLDFSHYMFIIIIIIIIIIIVIVIHKIMIRIVVQSHYWEYYFGLQLTYISVLFCNHRRVISNRGGTNLCRLNVLMMVVSFLKSSQLFNHCFLIHLKMYRDTTTQIRIVKFVWLLESTNDVVRGITIYPYNVCIYHCQQ